MDSIAALWEAAHRRRPDKTALIFADQRLTYAALADRVERLGSAMFNRWRVAPGDVVALFAPNCPEFVISYFAAVRQRLVVQPVDERLTAEEAQTILADSHSRHMIVHRSLWPRLGDVRERLPWLSHLLGIGMDPPGGERLEAWLDAAPHESSGAAARADDVAELMYTSGTTGEPKGVMRSHANVRAAVRNSITGFGYREDDVIVITMPMSHSSALNSQMIPLLDVGGTVVLLDRFDIDATIEAIRAHRGTCMRAVPAMLGALLSSAGFRSGALPSLRLIVNSSAPIEPAAYMRLKERFPDIEVANSYGLTEASTCTVLADAFARSHTESVGRPIDGVEMSVLGEDGRPVPDDEEGEICVRGGHVFVGYLNRPEATRAVLSGGLLRTGDRGRRDRDGFYYLHGRVNEQINCGGRKVSPMEVERCILRLPGVAEVAVAAAPHRTLGQVGRAFVVRTPGIDIERKQVIRHCARHLSSHKVPFHVEFVEALPKNGLGKVLRRKLQGG